MIQEYHEAFQFWSRWINMDDQGSVSFNLDSVIAIVGWFAVWWLSLIFSMTYFIKQKIPNPGQLGMYELCTFEHIFAHKIR